MENASKALLIAAAVLIAILIITLGLAIYNIASGAVENVNLTQAEIRRFNAEFENYKGQNVSGTKVNALIKTVFEHNLTTDDVGRKVSIGGTITLATNATTYSNVSADTGKTYSVTLNFSQDSGLVTSITVTLKGK